MANRARNRLRAYFAQHNRRVASLALTTAAVSIISWGLLYFVAYWLTLLTLTIAAEHPLDVQAPRFFPHTFVACGVGLCVLAWMIRRAWPDEYPRDKKSIGEIIGDFILMVPRMTLAIWGTLRALQFLNAHELDLAMRLLQRIEREKSLPVYATPLEIPNDEERHKIVLALQITELIDLRKIGTEVVLALRDEKARSLCQKLMRIALSH